MGVDLQTYRSRIGGFVSNRCKSTVKCQCMADGESPFVADDQSSVVANDERSIETDGERSCVADGKRSFVGKFFAVDINDVLIFLVGATAIFRMLLLMAGVESNPGPTGTEFSFRYQYLLIQVGSHILRKLFDHLVCGNFSRYLNDSKNAEAAKQLGVLKLSGKLTAPQQMLIPPTDPNSSSKNFDITLLCCLLRNVCGLKNHSNKVWLSPAVTDRSVEANISRLRMCRNDLMHSGSVYDSKTDLDTKWKELCLILTEIGTYCGMALGDIQLLISEAETVVIDTNLKEQFDETITAWSDLDKRLDHRIDEVQSKVDQCIAGQDEIKDSQRKLGDDLESVKEGQGKLGEGQNRLEQRMSQGFEKINTRLDNVEEKLNETKNMMNGIKDKLIDFYKKRCRTLPESPLCNKDIDELELLSFYKPPSLHHVDYHKPREFGQSTSEQHDAKSYISGYKNIFYENDKRFRKVFITGDAGVGKTSFCKRVATLWTMSQCGKSSSDRGVQNDIDFLSKFDFVFFISLSGTLEKNIVKLIVEQLLFDKDPLEMNQLYKCVKQIIRETECIIMMDALDERKSTESVTVDTDLSLFDTCTFLITCRPYKIENERLSRSEIDRQVQMTGIDKKSINRYITEIVNRMNENKREKKNPQDFVRDAVKCRLKAQLRIPIICSHLVAVWFKRTLTNMSRALIYSNIVDMLFKRAEKEKQIELHSLQTYDVKLPDCLSELRYLKNHIPFLHKLCLLSFNVSFKQDKCLSELVFTPEQLESEPYCLSAKEMDFLCKFGILSKSKVISEDGQQEQRLSYIHKTYIEYFSALFVSTFDLSNAFDKVVDTWNSIEDVVQLDTFFIFLVGFSYPKSNDLIEKVYPLISRDLNECRRNAIFYFWDNDTYKKQLKSLQTMIINCFKEIRGSHSPHSSFKLEDFIFDESDDDDNDDDDEDDDDDDYDDDYDDDFSFNDDNTDDICKQLLSLNTSFVKSIHSEKGEYLSEFDHINSLQFLHVGKVTSDYLKFIECMLRNNSSMHTLSIAGNETLIQLPAVRCVSPLRSFFHSVTRQQTRHIHHLTSLSLYKVKLEHKSFKYLVKYLSDNVNMQNIRLRWVGCDEHKDDDSQCTKTLDLKQHKQLHSLCLLGVNIICNKVNTSNLKSLALEPVSDKIVSSYVNVLHCINNSQHEDLVISGDDSYRLDNTTMRILTSTLSTLQYIKVLVLSHMRLPDDVTLQLHHDVSQVLIVLDCVKMSQKWFESFCDSLVNYKSVIKVCLGQCNITTVEGDSYTEMSVTESVDMIYKYLNTQESSLNITYKDHENLYFETRKSQ